MGPKVIRERRQFEGNGRDSHTFVCVLVKATEGVDAIVAAVRQGGIDQTCGDMALGLVHSRDRVGQGSCAATARRAGRHQVCILRLHYEGRRANALRVGWIGES